jgi:signal transduction histidine kinase
MNGQGDPRLLRAFDNTNKQADRMTRLINDLLDVSRLESDELRFYPELFDLNGLVEEVVTNLALTAPQFAVTIQPAPAPVPVLADAHRLEQVLTNLMQNAFKYSERDLRVDVMVEMHEGTARVGVRDYGIGIPPDQQARVFQRFFRARNADAQHYGGLGLGLYIASTIVARHNGRMTLESAPGSGTTVWFSLPLATEAGG